VLQTLLGNPELWKSTALFITYDEHDGFFDHQLPPFPEASVTDEPHRPSSHQPFADVTVDRSAGTVTARLTSTGKVGTGFAVYPDAYLPAATTPVTVTSSAPGSYTWDTLATAGKYAFSVYGPDGFVTSFAGSVAPASLDSGPIPVVSASLRASGAKTVELSLATRGSRRGDHRRRRLPAAVRGPRRLTGPG
jgi:phospholipase C